LRSVILRDKKVVGVFVRFRAPLRVLTSTGRGIYMGKYWTKILTWMDEIRRMGGKT
jgi:hypothetical protein